MFSATISREVLDIGWLYQHNAAEVSVQPVEDSSPKIAQYKLLTTGRDKLADAAQIILSEGYKRVMIFCNTKYNTGMLANQLARLNFNVDCLHGDLSQAERNRIMTRFKAGEIAVLVATDVAARGIDVSDVDAVINYDVPEENEHYTHRIGRTGRARKEGASYLFYTKEEQKRVDQLLRLTRNLDDCKSVKFDFNHEKLIVEEAKPQDRFPDQGVLLMKNPGSKGLIVIRYYLALQGTENGVTAMVTPFFCVQGVDFATTGSEITGISTSSTKLK